MTSEPEDRNLHAEYDRLNQAFYGAEPASYFRTRLNMLVLAASRGAGIDELVEGSKFDVLTVRADPAVQVDPEVTERVVRAYVTTEAHTLRYNASEALVRLFLAHAATSRCPWAEMAALRGASALNAYVDKLRGTEPINDAIANVFTGNYPDVDSEAIQASERIIRLAAGFLHDERNLHNAVKHGLGVVVGRTDLQLTRDHDGETMLALDGPSFVYLESKKAERPKTWDWSETTSFVELTETMLMTNLLINQIDALWTVARARYTSVTIPGVRLVTNAGIEQALAGSPSQEFRQVRFSRGLWTEHSS